MTTAPRLQFREIPLSLIDIPREYIRKTANEDADKRDAASVADSGIIQPLAVIPNGSRFTLVKGTRRIAMAEANDLKTVPAIVNFPPTGLSKAELKAYRDKLRNFLFKRQDLRPSEWVSVVREAQRAFNLNNKEMAALLKIDPATLTNNYRIEHYAKPIVAAIDRGEMTLHHAESLFGMRPAGQVKAFAELRDQLPHLSGRAMKAVVAKKFNPKRNPDLWIEPEKAANKIADRPAKRRRLIKARQSTFTAADRERLSTNLELLETEQRENDKELKRAELLLRLVGPIHRAVSADDELNGYVAKHHKRHLEALEAFSEHGY